MEQLPRSEVGKNKEYIFSLFFVIPISSQKVKYWEDHLKAGINIDIIFQHQTNQPINQPTNQHQQPTTTASIDIDIFSISMPTVCTNTSDPGEGVTMQVFVKAGKVNWQGCESVVYPTRIYL